MRTRLVVMSAAFLGIQACCTPSHNAQSERNKGVIHKLVEAVNSRNYDLLGEIVTRDFVRHCQAAPDVHVRSRDELKRFLRQDLGVLPDSRTSVEMILAEGDMVAGHFTVSGTQERAIGPFPATRQEVEVGYLSIMRVEDGKIAEMWVEWDNLATLPQLGYWPPKQNIDE